MTSFYSWRLYFMTFEGKPRWGGAHGHDHGHDAHKASGHAAQIESHDEKGHGAHAHDHHHAHTPHESPWVMLVPLAVLSVGAIAAGFLFKKQFFGDYHDKFWKGALFTGEHNHILHDYHQVPGWVVASPFVAMLIGFGLALYMYVLQPGVPGRIAARHEFLYRFLLNKWYFDELYDAIFVRPAKWLGRFLWKKGDGAVIDGLGPDGVSARVVDVTDRVVKLQTATSITTPSPCSSASAALSPGMS